MPSEYDRDAEWLEVDGLGGFASGTVGGVRTRRYHALLLPATDPPAGRMVLVNGFDAWLETPAGQFPLTSQRYVPGIMHPSDGPECESFSAQPWPTWQYRLRDGTRIRCEIFVHHGAPLTAISWALLQPRSGARLFVRPLFSGRDYHALHHENDRFQFAPEQRGPLLIWRTYPGVPAIASLANAEFRPQPVWYRQFLYERDRERGQDFSEDLAAPGVLCWNLSNAEAVWLLAAGDVGRSALAETEPQLRVAELRALERARRARFDTPMVRAADAYLAQRGAGKTIIAGYPWFTDWGRDTFIAMRGLCFATGRLDEARQILLEWSDAVSEGMLPNRFPDRGERPDYNSVDASLWYVIVVFELLAAAAAGHVELVGSDRARLLDAVQSILSGYAGGTRYGIQCADDGLLAAGSPGTQLTWMDAKIGDWAVTPRIGKPVEVQALWLNALWMSRSLNEGWARLYERGQRTFRERFWNASTGALFDVVDADHQPGALDARIRPNQIFAVGGLLLSLLERTQARQIVDLVERELWTPLGLRTLAPREPGYCGRYEGDMRARDAAYHQGTAWPWLIGPFVEAWVKVRDNAPAARREARQRFLQPLLEYAQGPGFGHLPEVADGDPPQRFGGCPFQAWSVGEALRLDRLVLGG